MEAIGRAEHDLRHHLSVIRSYSAERENKKLDDYLSKYIESLPDKSKLAVCENSAVNSILQYYIGIAKKEGVAVDVNVNVPANTNISDTDLCIVFGNCFENAIEACRRFDGEKFIKIRSKLTKEMFTIIIANSFDGSIKKEGDKFLSLKHDGEGIGIPSVKAVVEKYGDSAQFEADGNEFRATIILCVTQE